MATHRELNALRRLIQHECKRVFLREGLSAVELDDLADEVAEGLRGQPLTDSRVKQACVTKLGPSNPDLGMLVSLVTDQLADEERTTAGAALEFMRRAERLARELEELKRQDGFWSLDMESRDNILAALATIKNVSNRPVGQVQFEQRVIVALLQRVLRG